MKLWDPHTKKLKYCSYEKIDEHTSKFGKGCLPGSELTAIRNTSTLQTLKVDLSDHSFIICSTANFPSRGTPIGIIAQYCEYYTMQYIYQ